jgi:hypothetical protein
LAKAGDSRANSGLLSYFFKLGAEHIHSPVGVKVAGQRDACHAVIPAEAGEASSAFRLER